MKLTGGLRNIKISRRTLSWRLLNRVCQKNLGSNCNSWWRLYW